MKNWSCQYAISTYWIIFVKVFNDRSIIYFCCLRCYIFVMKASILFKLFFKVFWPAWGISRAVISKGHGCILDSPVLPFWENCFSICITVLIHSLSLSIHKQNMVPPLYTRKYHVYSNISAVCKTTCSIAWAFDKNDWNNWYWNKQNKKFDRTTFSIKYVLIISFLCF